jgi:hypothetical protein
LPVGVRLAIGGEDPADCDRLSWTKLTLNEMALRQQSERGFPAFLLAGASICLEIAGTRCCCTRPMDERSGLGVGGLG